MSAAGVTDPDELSAILEAIEAESAPVEIPMIHIKAHWFYFTAVPKHADDSFSLSTSLVEISTLDDDGQRLAL